MLFGTIERKKCFFMGSLSPICMKTAAQLFEDWELALARKLPSKLQIQASRWTFPVAFLIHATHVGVATLPSPDWTKAYGVPCEIMVRYLRYWSLVSCTGSLRLVREHDGPYPKCFKVTCETEDPKWICDIVYVLDDEKEDDRIFIVQMRHLSLLAIRLFGDDEKLAAEALPFDESVPDDSVPTVAKPARASGTGTARAPSTNT